jgi:hypothetical protein
MASQRADIGRYEARRGVPRPPPQPTGTMGPPGPCPVPLAPWGDAQAPEPRPIQQAARSAVSLVWPCVGDLHPPTHLGWEWEVPTTPGATRGHWGGVGRVSRRRGASMAKKSLQWVVLGQNPSSADETYGHLLSGRHRMPRRSCCERVRAGGFAGAPRCLGLECVTRALRALLEHP